MEEFKEGDLVQLKSGGPVMTISKERVKKTGTYLEEFWDDTLAVCVWFDENNKPMKREFKKSVLKKTSN